MSKSVSSSNDCLDSIRAPGNVCLNSARNCGSESSAQSSRCMNVIGDMLLRRRWFGGASDHRGEPGSGLFIGERVLLPLEKGLSQRTNNFLRVRCLAQALKDGQVFVILDGVAECLEAYSWYNPVVAHGARGIDQRPFAVEDDAFLALLRLAIARVERCLCPRIIGLTPIGHSAPIEETLHAIAPGHPGRHTIIQ